MKTVKASRNSNVELLRIISLMLVVAHHYNIWSFPQEVIYTGNKYFLDVFGFGGQIGLFTLILISGYYMVNSRSTIKRLLDVWGHMWFYSVTILLIFWLSGSSLVDSYGIKISILPFYTTHYWFVTYYLVLIALSPFINAMLHNMNRRQHAVLCAILLVMCVVLPDWRGVAYVSGVLPIFIVMYVCGAYFRLYIRPERKTGNRAALLAAVYLLGLIAYILARVYIGQKNQDSQALIDNLSFMLGNDCAPAVLAAMLLMLAFSCREAGSNRFICFVGGLSFGVYLFQSNHFIGCVLWQGVLKGAEFTYSPWLPLHAVLSVLLVFAFSCLLDCIWKYFVGRYWNKLIDKCMPHIDKLIESGAKAVRKAFGAILCIESDK